MTVLAAVDVDEEPERVIRTGHEFATAFEEPLVVLYVASQGDSTLEQATSSAKNKVSNVINETLDTHEGVEEEGRVGVPEEEILAAIEEIGPRIVVIGGRKRSPVKQLLFGSVSQSIVRNAELPVVTLMEGED